MTIIRLIAVVLPLVVLCPGAAAQQAEFFEKHCTDFRDDRATGRWEVDQGGHAARTFNVTIRIEELAAKGEVPFAATRSRAKGASEPAGKVVFRDGKGTVAVSPLELVTLRSEVTPP